MKLSRLPALDGLRACAALMVMAFHFTGYHDEPALVRQIAVIGQTGVDLFFVLSGFLITRILLNTKATPGFFRTFYARRALRIFPLYYGYLAFHYFIQPWLFGYPAPGWEKQWWFWLYLQNVPATFPGYTWSGPGHFWSLAIEEHFYLFWPLAVWALSRRAFATVTLAVLVGAPVLRMLFLADGLQVFFFTFTRMDALAYGALLALVATSGRVERFLPALRWLAVILPALLVPAFVFLSGSQTTWLQVLKSSLIPATYAAVMGCLVLDPRLQPAAGLFTSRPLRWIGTISYGLYVYHPLAFDLSRHVLHVRGYAADLACGFGLAIAIAALSYRFFEEPIMRLKSRFEYARPSSRLPSRVRWVESGA